MTVKRFLKANKGLAEEFQLFQKKIFDPGFNVFTLSSDLYYRENFHSDIIKAFLDPNGSHNEGARFLDLFIDLINLINPKQLIEKNDFKDAIVVREKVNIDILIVDSISKKAIIIENKINNAVDQPRQLPRYYQLLSNDYLVSAIVYLTIDNSKSPAKHDWDRNDLRNIDPILKVIPAIDAVKINLFNNWVVPSIIESKSIDSMFILRQYGNLLKHLNSKTMDTIILEKFYTTLKDGDNLNTSLSLRNMLNDVPEYLAIRLQDKYRDRCFPFSKIWRYQLRDCVFEAFKTASYSVKMDVWCSTEGYKIHVWNPDNEEFDIKQNLPTIMCIKDFEHYNGKVNNVVNHFNFFEEDKVHSFIDTLIEELKTLVALSY